MSRDPIAGRHATPWQPIRLHDVAAHPADAPPRHSQGVTQLEPSEEPAAQLDVGIAVKVDGLASKPELNGKVRIPHRSHTDTTRIPHRYHTDTTRIPHR